MSNGPARRTLGLSVLAFVAAAAAGRADAPPLRHLVYSFTYESDQNGAVPNEAGSSGARSYSGSLNDMGTITVDVLREASDRGLVVTISEQGQSTRRAAPATCAVYGSTDVVCDPSKQLNSEEYTLMRFLGANFFDSNLLDTKQHWAVSHVKGNTKVTADYTVASSDGDVLKISETRHVEDTTEGATTIDTQAKLDYNVKRLLPLTIDEYTIEQQHSGYLGTTKTTYQTTLNLVSDSMAK